VEAQYIARTSDCWLRVQLADGVIVSLPFGLKVKRMETQAGREHFEIIEGVYKGKKASRTWNTPTCNTYVSVGSDKSGLQHLDAIPQRLVSYWY